MSMWLMYLILKLDMISCFLGVISIIPLAVSGVLLIIIGAADSADTNDVKEAWEFFKPIILIAIAPLILFILMPTTKQAAAIYFVPKVINNKQIRKMPDKLVTLANAWMNEQIKSVKGRK